MTAFRFAVLGTGSVARAFALGLRASDHVEVGAVGSRTPARAQEFVDALGLGCLATDHAGVLGSDVDAVYIATPPSTHRDLALAALAAGKPVLVEKPFATDAALAREVVEAARSAGLFCMEALWTRFLPLVREVDALLAQGAIGDVTGVTGSFGNADVVAPHLLDPALGGGALLDRGVYPLSFVVRALGRPESVSAQAVLGPTGVDEETAAVLRHPGGGLSTVHASLRGELGNDLRYTGTRGSLWVRGPAYRPASAVLVRGGERTAVEPAGAPAADGVAGAGPLDSRWAHGLRQVVGLLPPAVRARTVPLVRRYAGNGYHYQAEEVARCVRLGLLESPVMPVDESLAVMETVDQIRAAAGHRPDRPA
ncbi:Gfo/Idh/MocA family protein [Microlunatus flavus]|uniref:Predicted dehydrogenase n=1 Tax=Microlunatus flavus TaxID=1036181 RepID=A0A1H9CLU2_9ACTN|nr:Gfo/Idh/MocA family oxidoreductase [Microlunatus flavus]SEQ02172.1 Predicted dehydrogenase [Microlunatus flavus]